MAARHFIRNARLYSFIAGYVLVLGCLAYFGYVELSEFEETQKQKAHAAKHEDLASTNALKTYYTLPRMELTLSSFEGETHHARLGISLEIEKINLERFADFQPRVSDRIINFMRHKDIEEIRKPAAMFTLRRDLLHEVNQASAPIPVSDIIFREFVVR
jgi:flagellar basal body-associated protein FliL